MSLLYLSVLCFFSVVINGCSSTPSTPEIIISSLDEIRQISDPSKKLVVFFNESSASVNIITGDALISRVDAGVKSQDIGDRALANDLSSDDPERRERAEKIKKAGLRDYYENKVPAIRYGSGRLWWITNDRGDMAAFNLDSGGQIRLFVDGTTITESATGRITNYKSQVLPLHVKPDANEQFYVIMDTGTGYVVREITGVSTTAIFSQKAWRYSHDGFASEGSKGYIPFIRNTENKEGD
jgi:hypothetical protein